MGSSPEYALLGDIGATNARLALLSKGLLGPIERFTVAEFARFTDLVDAFLELHCRHVSVPEALLAVAGPVAEDRCVLTNCPWTIDATELCARFSFANVHIFNDFEAIAMSLPHLTSADLYPLGGGAALSPRRGRLRSLTVCAVNSGTYRQSGSFQDRVWKIFTAQSSCSTESTPRRATPPRSQSQHWTAIARQRGCPSSCSAQCWERLPETRR
jgi:Glucokinase